MVSECLGLERHTGSSVQIPAQLKTSTLAKHETKRNVGGNIRAFFISQRCRADAVDSPPSSLLYLPHGSILHFVIVSDTSVPVRCGQC